MYWRPGFGVLSRCDKRSRHDPNDGVTIATKGNRLAKNFAVTIELFQPQRMTEHDHVGRAYLDVGGGNVSSSLRRYSQQLKKAPGHLSDLKLFWLRASGIRQWLGHQTTEFAEGSALRLDVSEVGC